MKILLSAFACAPDYGSEPGIGWGVAQQIARKHSLWVLTSSANHPFIMKALSNSLETHGDFVFVQLPLQLDRLSSNAFLHHLHYFLWQFFAYRTAKRLHRKIHFDLVHHVTYGASWLPSFMGWLGIPFIWSAGARNKTPLAFLSTMSWRSRMLELLRNLVTTCLDWITLHVTASRASLILTSSDSMSWPSTLPVRRFAVGGLSLDEIERLNPASDASLQGKFHIASIGRLLGWKGFSLGLEAFARLHRRFPQAEFWIFGNGPEKQHLIQLARALGCLEKVKFTAWLPRKELHDRLRRIDVLVHPSLHEQFGFVILESMAAEKPILCLDVAGPSLLVDEESGFKVTPSNPLSVILELSNALRSVMGDPQAAKRMGKCARKRAEETWTWESVGKRILALYDEVEGKSRCGTS